MDPLKPEATILIKLGSLAVHADEFLSVDSDPMDAEAIKSLLSDPAIVEWMKAMDAMAFLPVKRNP